MHSAGVSKSPLLLLHLKHDSPFPGLCETMFSSAATILRHFLHRYNTWGFGFDSETESALAPSIFKFPLLGNVRLPTLSSQPRKKKKEKEISYSLIILLRSIVNFIHVKALNRITNRNFYRCEVNWKPNLSWVWLNQAKNQKPKNSRNEYLNTLSVKTPQIPPDKFKKKLEIYYLCAELVEIEMFPNIKIGLNL